MSIFIPVFLHEATAAILTAGGCWLALRRHRQPCWYLAFVGTIVLAAVEILAPDGGLLFHSDRRDRMMISPTDEFKIFLVLVGIAIIPALLVVRHYRKKFQENVGLVP